MIRLYAYLALAAALAFGAWYIHDSIYDAGAASVQARWDKENFQRLERLAEAGKRARVQELTWQSDKDKALDEAEKRRKQAAVAAADARIAGDRLRDYLNRSRPADLSCSPQTPGADNAGTLRGLLAACSSTAERLAQDAAGWRSEALTLRQSWPK